MAASKPEYKWEGVGKLRAIGSDAVPRTLQRNAVLPSLPPLPPRLAVLHSAGVQDSVQRFARQLLDFILLAEQCYSSTH